MYAQIGKKTYIKLFHSSLYVLCVMACPNHIERKNKNMIYYLYNLYVSMFLNKKYMAWNFHLFSNLVSFCRETFQISDLVIFGLFQFVSVDLLL